jgi:hypothetical protein
LCTPPLTKVNGPPESPYVETEIKIQKIIKTF